MTVMTSVSNEVTRTVTEYLHKHFHKPPLGALARWSGEPGEYSYSLRTVVEHEASATVRSWLLVRVTAHEDFLWRKLQGGGSEGVFAVQDEEMLYLTPEYPENISRVLRAAQSEGEVAPEKIAALCCEVLLSRPNAHYSVLTRDNEISSWYPEARGYVRDRDGTERLQRQLESPRWEHDEAGARLIFYTLLVGFQSYQVRCVTVTISESEPVQSNEEVVVERVFERWPVVRTR